MSKLIDGCIPAHTECPFKEQCAPTESFCRQRGDAHPVPYSCAFARAYEMVEEMVADSNKMAAVSDKEAYLRDVSLVGHVADLLPNYSSVAWEECTPTKLVVKFNPPIAETDMNLTTFLQAAELEYGVNLYRASSTVSVTKGYQDNDDNYVVTEAKLHGMTFILQ